MRSSKKKYLKLVLLVLFMVCGSFMVTNCKVTTVQAASTATMKKAYQKYVKKNRRSIKGYAYANIGPSKKPALLVATGPTWGGKKGYYVSCKIYYYVNGKVKYLGTCSGARPVSLYRKGSQYYIWNGTSSDKMFECIRNNRVYVTWYMNAKEKRYKTQKSVYTSRGVRYTTYMMSYGNYDKALRSYKEVKMIRFSSVR